MRSVAFHPSDDDDHRLCHELDTIVPPVATKAFDVREVIGAVADTDTEFLEISQDWAPNIVCGLGRLSGHTVGFVANQPMRLAGAIDITASEKAARFVRMCDAFNVPLVSFVDVPGFLPGRDQEHNGIIRKGAALVYAFCEATVPRVQVILRKAYGGAYIVMNSKAIGADIAFAWPTAQIAVMRPSAAVRIIAKRELRQGGESARRELTDSYATRFLNPQAASERGYIDDVIRPSDTRRILIATLAMLRSKKERLDPRKHGVSPV